MVHACKMHLQYARLNAPCSQPRPCAATANLCTSTPGACSTRIACSASKSSSQTAAATAKQRQKPWLLGHHAGSVRQDRDVAPCVSRVGADVCTTSQQVGYSRAGIRARRPSSLLSAAMHCVGSVPTQCDVGADLRRRHPAPATALCCWRLPVLRPAV